MRIVLAQVVGRPGDVEANAVLLERTLQQYRGRDLVVFPELFLSGYIAGRDPRHAVGIDDEVMNRIGRAAQQAETDVIFGFSELRSEGLSNSVAHMSAQGHSASVYRKAQLFGEGESSAFIAGETLTITDIGGTKAGLLNCFDVEFPEHARTLALAGAEVLVTIAANMDPYGPDHAMAVRSRAVENRRFHVYVNRVHSEASLEFVGESCVVTPMGDVVRLLGAAPAIVEVDIDLERWENTEVDYLRYVRSLPVAGTTEHRDPILHGREGGLNSAPTVRATAQRGGSDREGGT